MPGGAFFARARTDGRDWLVEADEPLAGLQLRSGGELPGIVATPALHVPGLDAERHLIVMAPVGDAQRVVQ